MASATEPTDNISGSLKRKLATFSPEEVEELKKLSKCETKKEPPLLVEEEDLLSNGLVLLDLAHKKLQAEMEELKHTQKRLSQFREKIQREFVGDMEEFKGDFLNDLSSQIDKWYAQVKSFHQPIGSSEKFLVGILSLLRQNYTEHTVPVQAVSDTLDWMRGSFPLTRLKENAQIKKGIIDLSNVMQTCGYVNSGTKEKALIIAGSLKSLVA